MFSTSRRRLAWLMALIAVSVVGIAALAFDRHYHDSLQAVRHTLATQRAIHDVLSTVKDAETGQRGYILTHDRLFLRPYHAATLAIAAKLDELDRQVAADPMQVAAAKRVRALVDPKLKELA